MKDSPGTYFVPASGTANRTENDPSTKGKAITRTIAFLGGSITEMHGFRPLVVKKAREQFPDVAFYEIAAGLSSTCSDAAAFRLAEDVLTKGTPDVLFLDTAVNDDQDGSFSLNHCIRGMEGVVRHIRRVCPSCIVIPVSFVNVRQVEQLRSGEEPIPYQAARIVAERYGLPVVDIGTALVNAERTGTFSWERYVDCHPSPEGCEFAASIVFHTLLNVFDPYAKPTAYPLPDPLDVFSYDAGAVLTIRPSAGSPWHQSEPDWESVFGEKRENFLRQPLLWCETEDAEITIPFTGRALAGFVLAGPDAGALEVSVDGSPFHFFPLKALYGSLHYPYVELFADELSAGPHTAILRVRSVVRNGKKESSIRLFRLYENR